MQIYHNLVNYFLSIHYFIFGIALDYVKESLAFFTSILVHFLVIQGLTNILLANDLSDHLSITYIMESNHMYKSLSSFILNAFSKV